jgi:hypothetical protein
VTGEEESSGDAFRDESGGDFFLNNKTFRQPMVGGKLPG